MPTQFSHSANFRQKSAATNRHSSGERNVTQRNARATGRPSEEKFLLGVSTIKSAREYCPKHQKRIGARDGNSSPKKFKPVHTTKNQFDANLSRTVSNSYAPRQLPF